MIFGRAEGELPAESDLVSVDMNANSAATFDSTVAIDVRLGKAHAFAFNLDKAVLFDPVTTRRI